MTGVDWPRVAVYALALAWCAAAWWVVFLIAGIVQIGG